MTKLRINHQILLLIILAFVSGCNDIGTAKFDEVASGTGLSQDGNNPSPTPTPTPPGSTFAGLNSIGNKTDSTVTLNWSTHPNALQYLLYDVSSGTPTYLQTISNPATNSVTLTGLTPDATYKYRLKMTHNQGVSDDNTNDLTVVMNHAPATPSTPTYNTPASSPGTNNKPTFTVGGVKAGDVIRLYKDDATCNSTAVASGTVGSGQTSIDLQLSSVLTLDGTYTFYADAANSASHRSSCTGGLSYQLIQPTCPTGYIQVLANTSLGVNNDFCVAQYEMKNVSSVATSQATGNPWVSISATNSWNACLALNTETGDANKLADTNNDGTYALISNAEWMTIARSIEDEASNWVGGVLNRGWAASTSYGDSWTHSAVAPQTNTNCLYSSAANTCASSGAHKFKRTHTLKNGEEIWDFSGNVYEWADWSSSDSSFTLGPRNCTSAWTELNAFNPSSCTVGPVMNTDDYMPLITANTSAQNIGRIYGGSGGAARRSGGWVDGSLAGPFALFLNTDASNTYTYTNIGFRCVWRP